MASAPAFSWAHLGLVAAGGVLGTAARAGLLLVEGEAWQTVAVPVINIVGALLLGVVTGLVARRGDTAGSRAARQFFGTGVLGGFTTYSTFAVGAAHGVSPVLTIVTAVIGVVAGWAGLLLVRGGRRS